MVTVLKTVGCHSPVGSNPTFSAKSCALDIITRFSYQKGVMTRFDIRVLVCIRGFPNVQQKVIVLAFGSADRTTIISETFMIVEILFGGSE